MFDLVILGGGISGLSLAYFLERTIPSLSTILIEPKSRFGGWISSEHGPSGQMYEAGPRCLRLRGKAGVLTANLLTEVGLHDHLVFASPFTRNRYVILNKKPCLLPSGPSSLFTQPIGRHLLKKTLLEPFRKAKETKSDESIAAFFSRRSPSPIIEKLVDALVTGIWGGDPHQLSIYGTFPELAEDEHRWGSCLIGRMINLFSRKESSKISGICSLKGGLSTLPNALCSHINFPMYHSTELLSVTEKKEKLLVNTSQGEIATQRIVYAIPEQSLHRLKAPFQRTTPHASFVTVTLGWKADHLEQKGFGMLAPSTEDPHLLGIMFDSSIFPELSTHMQTRLAIILGGVRWPEVTHQSNEALLDIALNSIKKYLHITHAPDEYQIFRAPSSIPQPSIGQNYQQPFLESPCSRSFAINASIGGVSINQCIYAAHILAQRLQTIYLT